MKNNLEIFKNEEFGTIRTVEDKGKVLFCGNDVAKALGYSDTAKAIKQHCKRDGWANYPVIDNRGRTQQAKFINEGNLYRLIASSKLPSAEKFESWVFDEVLPSIRKHGTYLTDDKIEEILTNPDTIIKLATDLKNEREINRTLQIESAKKDQLIGELKPKADYTDTILQSKYTVPISSISKDYGMSPKAMNKKLHELRIQYKVGNQWLLYAEYQACGYTHSKTIQVKHKNGRIEPVPYTEWTQKGRLFLYNILKENGLVPMIEREN